MNVLPPTRTSRKDSSLISFKGGFAVVGVVTMAKSDLTVFDGMTAWGVEG